MVGENTGVNNSINTSDTTQGNGSGEKNTTNTSTASEKTALEKELELFNIPLQPSEDADNAIKNDDDDDDDDDDNGGDDDGDDDDDDDKETQGRQSKADKLHDKIEEGILDGGVETAANLIDTFFSKLSAWLNKDGPEDVDLYEAKGKDRKLLENSIDYWFKTFKVKFTPQQGVKYTILVVYGWGLATGIMVRIQDLFKWLFNRSKKKAAETSNRFVYRGNPDNKGNNADDGKENNGKPADDTGDEIPKKTDHPQTAIGKLMALPEEKRRKLGFHACEYKQCKQYKIDENDKGVAMWVKNKKYCCNECKGLGIAENNRDKKMKSV